MHRDRLNNIKSEHDGESSSSSSSSSSSNGRVLDVGKREFRDRVTMDRLTQRRKEPPTASSLSSSATSQSQIWGQKRVKHDDDKGDEHDGDDRKKKGEREEKVEGTKHIENINLQVSGKLLAAENAAQGGQQIKYAEVQTHTPVHYSIVQLW